MVFLSYALYPHMNVYDNLAFGLRRRGVEPLETNRRVRAVAAKLGLAMMLQRKPYELSGGQRQRVALGRAIVREPKVFLFDEPLSNLDAALRVTTRNELIRQQKELGTTTIYVTHDQVEAMTMGHRICIMNRGRGRADRRAARGLSAPGRYFCRAPPGQPADESALRQTRGQRRVRRLARGTFDHPTSWPLSTGTHQLSGPLRPSVCGRKTCTSPSRTYSRAARLACRSAS
jgi:ABC-type sulfate/molybdate transport systems ATPase subunit